MIQSVRLARQRALFLPFSRLFVFVGRFTRPVRVLSCLSPLFSHTNLALLWLPLRLWGLQQPPYLMACSFIIVSSSSPLGLMISNKPLFLENLWVEAFWLCCWERRAVPPRPGSPQTYIYFGMGPVALLTYYMHHFPHRMFDDGENPPIYSPHTQQPGSDRFPPCSSPDLQLKLIAGSRSLKVYVHLATVVLSIFNVFLCDGDPTTWQQPFMTCGCIPVHCQRWRRICST